MQVLADAASLAPSPRAGDLSYADSDQPRWDSYQRLVQNLSSNMPFMVASGNHESEAARLTIARSA